MATVFTFEDQFSTIHPPHRRNNRVMCPSFRKQTELARVTNIVPKRGLGYLLSEKAVKIQELKNLTEPGIEAMGGGGQMRYYLGDPGAEKKPEPYDKRTIEFREHESTLNQHRVHRWIEFCVHLVEFADDVEDDVLIPFLRMHIDETPEQYPLNHLLGKLGMPYLAHWYPLHMARREEEEKKKIERNMVLKREGKKVFDKAVVWRIFPGMTNQRDEEEDEAEATEVG
jgi:hypothetical protein